MQKLICNLICKHRHPKSIDNAEHKLIKSSRMLCYVVRSMCCCMPTHCYLEDALLREILTMKQRDRIISGTNDLHWTCCCILALASHCSSPSQSATYCCSKGITHCAKLSDQTKSPPLLAAPSSLASISSASAGVVCGFFGNKKALELHINKHCE